MTESEKPTLAILAVEDDPGVGDLLQSLLNDVDGRGATVARDAVAARSTFQQVKIDVLVLDVELPGISGLELLDLLRQDEGWQDQPVIIVSAKARQPEVRAPRARAKASHAKAHLGQESAHGDLLHD